MGKKIKDKGQKQYFNTYEFEKIKKLGLMFGMDADKYYEEYFLKYPKDYTTYPQYASFLIRNRKLDEADKILECGFKLAKEDRKFRRNEDKYSFIEKWYAIYKLKILFYSEDYQGVLDFYDEYYNLLKDHIDDADSIIMYCKKKLGILECYKDREEIRSYLFKQIVEYREEDFREHIKKHLADDAINMENASSAIFVPEFPIDEVIDEIKIFIPSDKGLYPGGIEDAYFFKYNECGRDNHCMTNYFKVFCFHGTSDFITMTPSVMREVKFPYVDLSYMKKEKNTIVRKKSRIEAFYNKYNIKEHDLM